MSSFDAVASTLERLKSLASSYGRQSCLYPGCSAMVPLQFYNLHLNYCRQKWRGSFITCPFNSIHRYGQPEDVFHRHICPDKAFVEAKILDKNVFKQLRTKNENAILGCNSQVRQYKLATINCSADLFETSSSQGDCIVDCNIHSQQEQSNEKLEEINVRHCDK